MGVVLSVAAHPSADTLRICQVDVGSEVIRVVTNAAGVEEEMKIAVAVSGGVDCGCLGL